MSTIILQTMDISKGHEQKEYNSKNKTSLRKMVRYIKEKLDKNFVLYGAIKGQELKKLLSKDMKEAKSEYDIEETLLNNDSFIMKNDTKLMVVPPVHGG